MKGLLIKDLKLMKGQKNFFFIMVVAAIFMLSVSNSVSFMLGYLPFVISLFTLTTISYDEFDNGNAFLFTLPVSRTGYAAEKYCLSLLLSGGGLISAALIACISEVLKRTANLSEIAFTAVIMLPVLIIIQAIMIPFQLKFGGEKGRIALIGTFGLIAAIGIVLIKSAKRFGIDISSIFKNLPVLNIGTIIVIMIIISAVVLLLSLKISISIMKSKEF